MVETRRSASSAKRVLSSSDTGSPSNKRSKVENWLIDFVGFFFFGLMFLCLGREKILNLGLIRFLFGLIGDGTLDDRGGVIFKRCTGSATSGSRIFEGGV